VGVCACAVSVLLAARLSCAQPAGQEHAARQAAQTASQATIDRLALAIVRGNVASGWAYLAAGGDPNARDGHGATLLDRAASANRVDVAELLLDHKADVNARVVVAEPVSGAGSTALDYAALNGHVAVARLPIDRGADVRAAYASGRTALHVAATHGRTEIVRLLLQKGADPNARDQDGSAPIDEAAWRGFRDIVALPLDAGARIDGPQTKTGATPLNEAAFMGQAAVVELLLARNASVVSRN
jgi:ankyrin repeat protein